MSTVESPPVPSPPAPPASPAPARRDRTVPVIIGTVLATVGSVIALGGGGVLAIAGTDGTLDSGNNELSTPTSALVSEVATINYTEGVSTVVGDPRVRATVHASQGGPDVFVGVARAGDVDRYLKSAAIDKVTDFDVEPFSLTKERRSGDATPKPPASQSFWVSKSVGRAPSMDWKVRDGDYRIVVMNADGSRGVSSDGNFELKLPHLSSIALAALIAGLVMVGAAVALIVPSIGGPGRYATPKPGVAAA
jgi:hypothetical protein